MKVLMINGSPHENGNTYISLKEIEKVFSENGIESEIINIGKDQISGCIACGSCSKTGKCIFDDKVNQAADKLKSADGLIVATPVYYASPNGTLLSFLDRLFMSSKYDKRMKIGASVSVARRGGTTATFDVLNKYFTISGMPIASSQYWNSVHGGGIGEALSDAEGLQTMRTLANNMIFLMRSVSLGKEKYGLPELEPIERTSFIR